MSPSAPELSVYRERKRGGGETRGLVTFWGMAGKNGDGDQGIIAGEVGERLIFRDQGERLRRTGDLLRSGRKNPENRWSSEIKEKDCWEQVSSEIRKKEHGEQVIFRDQEERTRRTGNISKSGRKNEEKRWSSKIRKMERGEQVIFREITLRIVDFPISENRWSFEIRQKESGAQVIFQDQEEGTRGTGNFPRSGRKNEDKRWPKIRKKEHG
jgi:hypothetical protein